MKLEDNDANKWSKIMKQRNKKQFVGSSDIEDIPKITLVTVIQQHTSIHCKSSPIIRFPIFKSNPGCTYKNLTLETNSKT